jgi:DNA end-binding protein Ku
MPARAIWKGQLVIGAGKLPVKLYSAVQDKAVHFHVLDGVRHERVKQRMVDPNTGKEVPSEEIRRGLEVEPGIFVTFTDEELAKFEPEASRDIEITRFVPADAINHQWFERPYYIGPDESDSDYFAFSKALADSGREGVARWVMRGKTYYGALQPRDKYLTLVTLRHAGEVLSAQELPQPSGRALDPREITMARQLVSVLEDEFRPEDFRDEYRERVMAFIEAKAQGKKPKLHVLEPKRTTDSLADALAASLAAVKQPEQAKKPAAKKSAARKGKRVA